MTPTSVQAGRKKQALDQRRKLHEQEEDVRQAQESTEGPIPQRKHSHLDPMGKLSLSGGYKPLPQHGRKEHG